MIMQALRRRIRKWVCPGCDFRDKLPPSPRLERAEQMHTLSVMAVAQETRKQTRRVSDMRVTANAAVRRLNHEQREIEGSLRGEV